MLWFEETFPECTNECYAYDIIIHCRFFKESLNLLAAVKQRMKQCKLEIKQEKSNIVYWKRNQKNHLPFKPRFVQFYFFGFTFKPRWVFRREIMKFTEAQLEQAFIELLEKEAMHYAPG